jgi:HSP20 family protein
MSSDPFDDVEKLFDRLSSQFDQLDPVDLGLGGGHVPVDLYDEGDAFSLVADLAGFDGDDIELTLPDERSVRISAERSVGTDRDDDGVYVRQERSESVARTVSLPEAVDESETSATFEAGVLTVTLHKREPDEDSHSIPVN